MVDGERIRQPRGLGLPLALGLVASMVVLAALGALYVLKGGSGAAPSFPAPPPGARRLWANQVTPALGSNQVTSRALYRASAPPSQILAYYRRALPGGGGTSGRFASVFLSGSPVDQPTAVYQLPDAFFDGTGVTAHGRYTFTAYNVPGTDVGIAVDLRYPHGPTLIFVQMLSQ